MHFNYLVYRSTLWIIHYPGLSSQAYHHHSHYLLVFNLTEIAASLTFIFPPNLSIRSKTFAFLCRYIPGLSTQITLSLSLSIHWPPCYIYLLIILLYLPTVVLPCLFKGKRKKVREKGMKKQRGKGDREGKDGRRGEGGRMEEEGKRGGEEEENYIWKNTVGLFYCLSTIFLSYFPKDYSRSS